MRLIAPEQEQGHVMNRQAKGAPDKGVRQLMGDNRKGQPRHGQNGHGNIGLRAQPRFGIGKETHRQ